LPAVVLFMTLFLAREAFRPLDRVEREYHAALNGVTAAPAIAALLEAIPSIPEPARPAAPPTKFDVVFDGVSFAYDGADRPALDNVSFAIGEHQRVALVGPSGAGKTTVVSLLLRFFDPAQGRIRIGGVELRDLSLADLRAQVALVAQDTYLFHGTI
jgi:ATP-binding cassette subfamily C protein CydCD